MTKDNYFIDISKQKDVFKEHLGLEQNERIIFSAKFGDGKTTFLREFFKNNPEYNAIHLYPVNYSVASNEDIFELIKYDILFELIATRIKLDESVASFVESAKELFQKNKEDILKILTPFLNVIPVIGGALKESTDRIIDFSKKALDHFSNSKKTEVDVIEEYLRNFTNLQGSIYEEDFYTRLITDLIERFKFVDTKNDNPKQTVLIVDDLDRIDPEHIFRILNVFAAHQDTITQGNKFGFDKVIVVCDIDNIRNIFHHKYGAITDFNGYIDKFYSVDVFKYSMMDELYEEVDSILNSVKGNSDFERFFDLDKNKNRIYKTLYGLLRSFVRLGIINVRNIVKLRNNRYILNKNVMEIDEGYVNIKYLGIGLFVVLKTIFGDFPELLLAFQKLRNYGNKINRTFDTVWVSLDLLVPIYLIGNSEKTISIPIQNLTTDPKVSFKLKRFSENRDIYFSALPDDKNALAPYKPGLD
jgi:hypothetical protein